MKTGVPMSTSGYSRSTSEMYMRMQPCDARVPIEMGCEVRDLAETIHPHPTLSETVMNAAEVFFGL